MTVYRRPTQAGLAERLDALATAVERAEGRLPAELVDQARASVERAGARRRLSGEHTVVALAGPTGSGKSSLFNVVTRLDLARVGVRRPTTSEPLACMWGAWGASPLLDRLGIPQGNQVPKESVLDSGEAEGLDGLILLDLPDHDSTHEAHRVQVDHLVDTVDLLVWVVDPQKYADAALHDRYLKNMAGHAAVTVVVLNQIDQLTEQDTKACVDDLERLLAKDGLRKVPILPVSAATGEGVDQLVELLRTTVGQKRAADDRVAADLNAAAGALLDAAGRGEPAGVSDEDRTRLVDALAEAVGVDHLAAAVGEAYRRDVGNTAGSPVVRMLAWLWPDPLRRIGLTRREENTRPADARIGSVQAARADSAVRTFADAAASGGPPAWVSHIRATAADAADRLPEALGQAVAAADSKEDRRPRWGIAVAVVQWLLLAVALFGAGWLLASVVSGWIEGADVTVPRVAGVSLPLVLLAGGLVLGFLIGLAAWLVAGTGALRRTVAMRRALRSAVATTAEETVVAPVTAEVERLAEFRTAATLARS